MPPLVCQAATVVVPVCKIYLPVVGRRGPVRIAIQTIDSRHLQSGLAGMVQITVQEVRRVR